MDTPHTDILFMLHLPPPVHGSTIVGRHVKESKMLNYSFHGRYINLILSSKVHESGQMSLKKLVRFIAIWFKLFGKLLYRKPALCYYALTTTGFGFYKDVPLIGLLRIFNVKIVYHIHNKGIEQVRKKRLNHTLYRFVFKNTYVILLSQYLYNDIKTYVPEDRVYYCANGIKDYQPSAALVTLSENRPFTILFLSNLIKEKGVFILLEACVILRDKGYTFQCDFVGGEGDITEKQFNELVQEKDLTKQVKYLGKRYGSLKEISFEEADVFVLPTERDCFPLVILEAMQHSLPVISTYEGGIPEIVDEDNTGYLFPPNDVERLVEKLELLLSNPQLGKQMGANGRAKYEKNFTLPIFEQRLLSILKDVINK